MLKTIKIFTTVVALLVFSSQSNASIITTNVSLSDVNDYTMSDSLLLWESIGSVPGSIDSFDLTLTWKDQGWGNHKGRIFYEIDNLGPIFLDLASHTLVTETLSAIDIMSPYNSSFKLFYTVGGGGGHSLHINNASLSITSVPEPSIIALMALGLAGVGFSTRRKAK